MLRHQSPVTKGSALNLPGVHTVLAKNKLGVQELFNSALRTPNSHGAVLDSWSISIGHLTFGASR